MSRGQDVAAAVSNLLVACDLQDNLVDAELVRALAEERRQWDIVHAALVKTWRTA